MLLISFLSEWAGAFFKKDTALAGVYVKHTAASDDRSLFEVRLDALPDFKEWINDPEGEHKHFSEWRIGHFKAWRVNVVEKFDKKSRKEERKRKWEEDNNSSSSSSSSSSNSEKEQKRYKKGKGKEREKRKDHRNEKRGIKLRKKKKVIDSEDNSEDLESD